MKIEPVRRLLPVLLLTLTVTLAAPVAASAEATASMDAPESVEAAVPEAANTRDFRFDVFLDGRRIGEHHFEVSGALGGERVRSRAEFEFRMLFVTLYRYRHSADEVWQEGCLTRLTSTTDDNGKAFAVEAAREDANLMLTRSKPDVTSRAIPAACPATFAYWDRERLNAGTLINTQTGDVTRTRLIREESELVDGVEAWRYRLEAEGLGDIHLWYRADDGSWLRLATHRDGRLLEYRSARPERA